MKKLFALLLACAMALSLCACGSDEASSGGVSPGSTPTAENTSSVSGQADLPAYKIGVLSHTNSGACWDRILDAAQYVAGELNCQVVTAVGSSPDQILSETENFIASGCDGIIIMNEGGVTSRLVDLCSEANVYIAFSDCGYTVTEDADYDSFKANKFYCGNVAHSEYDDSYTCASAMIENGAKNFVIFGLPPGISTNFDLRATGAIDAVKDAGLTYVEARSYSLAQVSPTIMSQYPDTDAIFSFVTTADSFNVEEFASNYGDKVQVSAYMSGDVTHEMEIGFLDFVSVGSEARIEMAFALLYNGLRGGRLAESDGSAPVIEFPHLWITDADQFKTFYANVTDGNHAYTMDEVKEWLTIYNDDVDLEQMRATAKAFSDPDGWLAAH